MERVSAIIPTYNRAELVGDAIESALTQSRRIDEVLVIDDGSTDNTREVLRSYGNKIRYIRQDNRGPGAARNRGIKEAKGDFIALLDSDDTWVGDKTETQLRFFKESPRLDFVFGHMANFSAKADNEEPEIKNEAIQRYLSTNAAISQRLLDCLIVENVIPTPTVMFKRHCIDRVGYFDESLKIAEDFDMWLRIAKHCQCGFMNRVLAKRRRHDNNLINDWELMNSSLIYVLQRFDATSLDLSVQAKKRIIRKISSVRYDLGSSYLKTGNFRAAYHQLRDARSGGRSDYKILLKLSLAYLLRFRPRHR